MSLALSVIVPAYDEAAHLRAHLGRLVTCLARDGRPFEVVVVDDGSRDGTGDVARAVAAEEPRVRVEAHPRNRGKGAALATGCAAARGALLVFADADLQIPPEDIGPLLARLEATGADLAVGSKYHPEAHGHWSTGRRALSRLYQLATALLFRLPLRDTQTGLKAVRADVARELVPRLRARRFAWDLELILLAHREGKRFTTGPVHVAPAARGSRVGAGGALQAGLDTLRIFARDVGLAAYRPVRVRRPRITRALVSGDDLGLSPAVDAGLLAALAADGVRSVSVLAEGPTVEAALARLRAEAPRADVGLHLDLLHGRSLLRFAWASLRAPSPGRELARQLACLRARGVEVTHVDAHRHAWCLPWVYGRVCRAVAAAGVGVVRPVAPTGSLHGHPRAERAKRLVLGVLGVFARGVPRAHGLRAPDAWVDAPTAAGWCRAGALPARQRGRVLEVLAHPALGAADWPVHEQGTLDRTAERRAVLEPPLAATLAATGVRVVDARTLRA